MLPAQEGLLLENIKKNCTLRLWTMTGCHTPYTQEGQRLVQVGQNRVNKKRHIEYGDDQIKAIGKKELKSQKLGNRVPRVKIMCSKWPTRYPGCVSHADPSQLLLLLTILIFHLANSLLAVTPWIALSSFARALLDLRNRDASCGDDEGN